MVDLVAVESLDPVRRIETTDPVVGHDVAGNIPGPVNNPLQALLNRTDWLQKRTGVQASWDVSTAALPAGAAPGKRYLVSVGGAYAGRNFVVGDIAEVISLAPDTLFQYSETSAAAIFEYKASVRVASTADIAVATALINGSTIDGIVVATGDRVLLKNQNAGAENGIYVVVASGAASRSPDADASVEVPSGTQVFVSQGTANGGKTFFLATANPITLGTTPLTFTTANGLRFWLASPLAAPTTTPIVAAGILAYGNGAVAYMPGDIVIGSGSLSDDNANTAGYNLLLGDVNSIDTATGLNDGRNIVIGYSCSVVDSSSVCSNVVVGNNASTNSGGSNGGSVAIGLNAAGNEGGVVIGKNSSNGSYPSVVVGPGCSSSGASTGVIVGMNCGGYGVTIGNNSTTWNNAISGIAVGDTCVVRGYYGIGIGGNVSTADVDNAVALGHAVNVSGTGSIGVGYQATVAGSMSFGVGHQASTPHSHAGAFGRKALTKNDGEYAFAHVIAGSGDEGHHRINTLHALTTDATATKALTPALAYIALPADSSAMMTGRVTAYQTGGTAGVVGDSAGWSFDALVSNVAGVYTLVGSSIAALTAPLRNSAGAALWKIQAGITAGSGVYFEVTGEVNKSITWIVTIENTNSK